MIDTTAPALTRQAVVAEYIAAQIEAGNDRTGFYEDLLSAYRRYGALTDRQVAAVERNIEREARWQMESASAEPVPEGVSVVILGEVLSVKEKENGYGVRLVMTVRDDHGFKVWGTVPRAIDDVQVGDRVTFVASVERSDRDRAFGFFKRPRDAHRI